MKANPLITASRTAQVRALVLMSLALPLSATAQVCTGDIVLLTQAEVDSFACKEVTGNLTIGTIWYWDDITNLDSLAELVTIQGSLIVTGNDMLPNLRGLSSLSTTGGLVVAKNKEAFTSLDGLISLKSVEFLSIADNLGLVSVDGLKSLRSANGGISIVRNRFLESLEGLRGILSTNILLVQYNDALVDLEGLNGLINATGDVFVDHNTALANLEGLSSLTSAQNIYIAHNPYMKSVDGLYSLESTVKGYLIIQNNARLENVDALSSLSKVGSYMRIWNNPRLSSCTCGLSNLLENGSVGWYVEFGFNALGCSSQVEVQQGSCGVPSANEEATVIASLDVKAAHPNPFTSATTLHYSLPKAGPVRLAVYDALGREVMVLVESDKPPGKHTVVFTAPDLSAGLYVVRLEQGSLTKSHVIVRVE